MDRKVRFILPVLMSGVMVFAVTLLVTFLNLGARADFVSHWLRAYFLAWPVAAVTGIFVLPYLQRASARIAGRLERRERAASDRIDVAGERREHARRASDDAGGR